MRTKCLPLTNDSFMCLKTKSRLDLCSLQSGKYILGFKKGKKLALTVHPPGHKYWPCRAVYLTIAALSTEWAQLPMNQLTVVYPTHLGSWHIDAL